MSQVDWNNYACRDFYDELLAAPGESEEERKSVTAHGAATLDLLGWPTSRRPAAAAGRSGRSRHGW